MFTLVTGATSDIGRQICATLEASGHSLLMTDLDEGALQEARSGLQHPEKHRIVPIDLSGVERAGELLSDYLVREQLPVSHAVFAAGLFAVKPLRMADYAFVKRSFDVALFSAVELTRVLTSKKANADHLQGIVLISSVSALVGTKGYAVYGAVKASLLGWMKSLAVELAPRVRVNAVLPGGIHTKTTHFLYQMQEAPDPRYLLGEGRKTDVSDMVDFLLSDKSRWVTGQSFVVDGGLTIH